MSAEPKLSRRAFASSLALLALTRRATAAQGIAGLGGNGASYTQVTPGKKFSFPADHGPHPDFHIEWWYVTANLVDAAGVSYGAQWTLFRTAMQPPPQRQGWASQQIW
ncbi:MAG: lipocalin-like domain-containing protein, partial [Bradyrhizobium sp.]